MILKFKYILFLSLIVLLHGKKKEKRDLNDLKDDPFLSTVFSSDVKEKRNDRSTTLRDELLAAKHDKARNEQLNRILFPDKIDQRRETDPFAEFMNLKNNAQPNANFNFAEAAKQHGSMPSLGMATAGQPEAAVNPALFQSNFIPLAEQNNQQQLENMQVRRSFPSMYPLYNTYPWKQNGYIAPQYLLNGRSYLPNNLSPLPLSTKLKDLPQDSNSLAMASKKDVLPHPPAEAHRMVIDYKKSLIPEPLHPEITSHIPSRSSFPVQLRVNSPNEKLRGIVPHVSEYGETVESVQQMQRAYKKAFIPQAPIYSTDIYKKTIIPTPDRIVLDKKSDTSTKKLSKEKKSKIKKNKKSKKVEKKLIKPVKKLVTKQADQRQYIPVNPFPQVQQFVPNGAINYQQENLANYQQVNPYSLQQNVLQPYAAPQVPSNSQVQNMDGLHTRPIITDEPCADQYASCSDFAKNNYCTNYPDLMKIQCRVSCGHCTPQSSQQQPTAPVANTTSTINAAEVKNQMPNVTSTDISNTTLVSSGSGELDTGSGSGGAEVVPVTGAVTNTTAQEDSEASGSGTSTDVESGNSGESGSGDVEESGSNTDSPAVSIVHQMPILNGARKSKIPKHKKQEFPSPVKKSVIPGSSASPLSSITKTDTDDDSGSGSGSGDESGDESGAESGDATADKKSVTLKKPIVKKLISSHHAAHVAHPTKKKKIPATPSLPGAYPKIDLRQIASALAHYEEAALELAGEYPKPAATLDMTEYTRSFIPHPVDKAQENINKYKQNLQVAKILTDERRKKSEVPQYLHLSKDAFKDNDKEEKDPEDADSLDSLRQRFVIPGLEPTLKDYYAETGKINPFEKNKKQSKKSKIESVNKKKQLIISGDPYEYLRNMPPGSSMEPIVDPKSRSTIPSDHSYPVYLMKVSPADKKYVDEPATRRGKIRKYNAEGLPIFEDEKRPLAAAVVNPHPAPVKPRVLPKVEAPFIPAAPSAFNNQFQQPITAPQQPVYQAPMQVQAALQYPVIPPQQPFLETPVQTTAQEQVSVQSPYDNHMEQLTAPKPSAMFAQDEQVQPEKQPGMNSLRSKMLSAFFSMKNEEAAGADEGSGGSGDGFKRGELHHPNEGSGSHEPVTKKSTISLHNLLFNDNGLKEDHSNNEISLSNSKAASIHKAPQDPSASYLQSNLAALTPEKPSYQSQSGLTSGRLGAQFTVNKMSKTQETNWVRPNAESELASAMPESSSSNVEATTSHQVPSEENSALLSTLRFQQQSTFRDERRPALRNTVPKVPMIRKPVEQMLGSSKTLIPNTLLADQRKIELEQKLKLNRIRAEKEDQLLRKRIMDSKMLSKDMFSSNNDLSAPKLSLASEKEAFDRTILTQFPISPFSRKSKVPFFGISRQLPNKMSVIPQITNKNLLTKDITASLKLSNTQRQTIPFREKPRQNIATVKNEQYLTNNNLDNEKTSSLTAKAGSAKYAVTQINSVNENANAAASLVNPLSPHGQYGGWNYLVPHTASIRPLSVTTAETNTAQKYMSTPVRKNLIKQKPDLDCGDNWEGAQGDFGTFCYKQMNMKATFDDALAECRRLKGDLFSVLNAYENRYLQDNIHETFWIGYRDKGMDGNWNWTDSSKSIYTNWGKAEGDDQGKRHDCVFVDDEEGKWKDDSCLEEKTFLCKKKTDACPKSWKNLKLNSANGCYKLFTEKKDWEDAERACQNEEAHLASLTSEDEQTMVFQVYSSKSYWIGLNDQDSEGDWQWSDRFTSSYQNWADKSPNNGGISCAAMVEGGKWHDEPCKEKLRFVCKRKGPKPEKMDGLDEDGMLLPVARLLNNADTAPSHVYDDLAKNGLRPIVPIYFWPLLKTTKSGMAGNRPMAVHGDVRYVPGGISLDGVHSFLDGGDFHGKCISEPGKCQKGFAVALQVYFENSVKGYKKPHCVIDTSGGGNGFTIYIANNKLNYKVISKEETWELNTDLTIGIWQEIVMTWHKGKGITVYVNGAIKDSETVGKSSDEPTGGTTRLIIGRENKDKGPYICTKMVIASVAIFTKVLSIEDVPYAFTYGDTVVATYRWLMSGLQNSVVPGAPDIDIRKTATDVDGGIYIDGSKGWLEIDDVDPILFNIPKAKHGFSISFKVKFDQRVRDYKEPKYILDTGGHEGGIKGVSVYIVNDNMFFQVISNPQEDIMIWKVRVPIYTVRWQRVVMTWRLDEGLWVYLDGTFRGYTKLPTTLPEQSKETPRRFLIGRKNTGPNYAGAQFAFGSLAIYGRFLPRHETENVFGGIDSPFPGIIREVWKNTPGESLKSLKANPDYPNNPSTIEIIENYDAPFNVDNNYGSKLKGYFIAPETGNSTFYLSCSKQCELYFSSDDEAKNKTLIVSLTQPTWHNQWNKYENQSSGEIFLVAGKYYYLEAIHKGVDASDSLSVGVRMPTGRYQRPIIKENLQWRLPGNQHAGLIREVWYDIPGYTIADLTSNTNFPNRPSTTEVLDKFDAPYNYADNYGSRITGYFHAPETGDYRFYLSTDSSGELWISSDESDTNLVKVITLNGWTDHNQWLKYTDQKSEKVFLAAGRYYFMRVYMKADKLGDCASVAVELPSGHFEGPIKKKHLSWKISGVNDGPGPKEMIETTPKPVGLFALNDASVKDILLPGENKLTLGDVDLATGPEGLKDDAFLFKGNKSSYIEIPNNGKLDTKKSITMLANIFPTGEAGPIINYKKDGWGVHLWQFSKTQLFARFVTKDGQMSTQPLGTHVLELNKWNQVGASYDHKSGVAQLWHDGKMVKSRNIGQVDLLTNANIRLGAREGDDRYYKGKISCIQIYDRALKEEQIGELRHCPKSKSKTTSSSNENDELTVFAQGSGMPTQMEEFDTVENRIGDDTEEELTAQGEKSKVTKCDPNPCQNTGVCQDDDKKIDGFICTCADDFTGKHCQVSKPAAENPIVKRTEIPKTYEKKEGIETYAQDKSNSSDVNFSKNLEESKEDISLLYQKLGCFKDDPIHRDLKTKVNLKRATQEDCAKLCILEDKSFSYFGLQNGTNCYCDKNYGKYGKLSDEECALKCEGNNEEICGGGSANDVFFFGLGTNYTVKTFTGHKLGAGTDAKIYVEFSGERGSSDFRQLDSHIEKYERGSVDQQTFVLPDLGKLKRMKILHDNTGSAPSWYLEKVQVSDEEGASYEFPCSDWLSDTQSGGKLERELQARSIVTSPT